MVIGNELGFAIALGVLMGLAQLMAADTTELEQLARDAVRHALDDAHLCIKSAAGLYGCNEATMRRMLNVERGYPLSFFRMLQGWPCSFWFFFSPRLLWLIGKKRIAEITNDTRMGA